MSDGGKRAVYDLTPYHIDGIETGVLPRLHLVRKDDKVWKLEGF